MELPPGLEIPEQIAKARPLSAEVARTKRMENISLAWRYLFRPDLVTEKFDEFHANWKKIEKDILARRLALHDIGKEYGQPMIEYVQYYEASLPNAGDFNGEEYLNNLSTRGYFPEKAEERETVQAAHQRHQNQLAIYREKVGLPQDFVPHLRSWRLTDIPPDLKIHDSLWHMPPLPRGLVRIKRKERVSLELNYFFNRKVHREKLQEFKATWENIEKNVLAMRLAMMDVMEKYDEGTIFDVNNYHVLKRRDRTKESAWTELKYDFIQEVLLPSELEERLKIYDASRLWETSNNYYRARLGLTKKPVPQNIPDRFRKHR